MKKVLIFLAGAVSALLVLFLIQYVLPVQQGGQSPDTAETGPAEVPLYFTATPEDEIVEDGGVRFGGRELLVQLQAGVSEEEARQLAAYCGAELVGFFGVTGTCQWRFGEMMDYESIQELAGELESVDWVLLAMPNYIQDIVGASEDAPREGKKWNNEASWDSGSLAEVNWGYVRSNALYAWQHKDEMTSPVKLGVMDMGFTPQDDLVLNTHGGFRGSSGAAGVAADPKHGDHVAGIAAATGGNGAGVTGVYPKAGEAGGIAAYDVAGASFAAQCYAIVDAVTSGARVINISIGNQDEYQYAIYMQMLSGNGGDFLNRHEKQAKLNEYVLSGLLDAGYDYLLVVAAGNASGRQYDIDRGHYFMPYGKDEDGNELFQEISAQIHEMRELAKDAAEAVSVEQWVLDVLGMGRDYVPVVDPRASSPLLYIGDERVADHILCVGAYNRSGQVATFSNMGDRVDILAPGQDIWSTVAAADTQGVVASDLADDGSLVRLSGTSQAAPYVAGAAACVWSMNGGFTSGDVRSILLGSAKETITDSATGLTKPVLNVEEAMRLAGSRQVPEEQPDPTKTAVRFIVRSARSGAEIDEYDIRLTAEDGTVQTLETRYENGTSSTGGIMYLDPGRYEALVNADHYRPLIEDIRVEYAEGLQEIELELMLVDELPAGVDWLSEDLLTLVDDSDITVSQSVIVWDGATNICGDMYANMVPEDAQENVTFIPGTSAVMLAEDRFMVLDRDGAIRLYGLDEDTAEDLVPAGGAALGQFALIGTDVCYVSADGSIMLLDLVEPENSGVLRAAAGGADEVWYMRQDGDSLAITSWENSDVIWHYRYGTSLFDANKLSADRVTSNSFRADGSAMTMDIELGGGYVLVSTPDGTIMQYREDGSDPEGDVVAWQASPLFELRTDDGGLFQNTLFWEIDGAVYSSYLGWDEGVMSVSVLAANDCCAVLRLTGERLFFLRNIMENGTFTGYGIYSCTDEGSDERYHGRLMLSADAAAQPEVLPEQPEVLPEAQPESGAQWDELIAELAAQYGVVGTYDMSMYTGTGQQTVWQDGDLTGLLSATVMDLDSDGEEELLTVRLDTYPEDFQGSGNTAKETHVWLQVYESGSSAGSPAAERMFYATPTMVDSFAASGQMSVFAYEYGGTVYIGLDNYSTFNDTSTMVDLFTYRDGQLAFVRGMAYLEFGQGDVYVWQADTEPSGRWINASTGFWGLNAGWVEIASYLAEEANWTAITPEEEASYYELYRAGLAEYGLRGTDRRIWVNQTGGSSWDYYGLFAQDVYTADSGVRFIAGFGKFRQYDGQEIMVLRRMDHEGTLDAYRQ